MRIVLDIETVRPSRIEWAAIQGINLCDEVDCSVSPKKDYDKCVFDGTFGRIVCIGLFLLRDDLSPGEVIAFYGTNEKGILMRFWDKLAAVRPNLIITHNGLGFDLPFIKKRSIINGVKPSIEVSLAKYRSQPVFDTMAEWSNWDIKNYTKLDVLARSLGIETKTGSGDQVAGMWERGEIDAIANYCLQDVYVTYGCYCRMTFREPRKSTELLPSKTLLRVDLET